MPEVTNSQPNALDDLLRGLVAALNAQAARIDELERHEYPGGGGINSPIFVPAIGGNWDFASDDAGWAQHQRVYGGGPYGCGEGGGIIEFNQIGISFKNGGYSSPYAGAFGIFTVPDGVTHIKMIPVFQVNAAAGDALHFFGELLGMDETGCETETYAYGDATIGRNLCSAVEVPYFVTAAQLESDAVAREVIRVYAEMDDRIQATACIFMLGWQTYLT